MILILVLAVLAFSGCSKTCPPKPKLQTVECPTFDLKFRTGKYEVMIDKKEFKTFISDCKKSTNFCKFLNKQAKDYNEYK